MSEQDKENVAESDREFFERLKRGTTILSTDPQAYKMRKAAYHTKALVNELNSVSDPTKIREVLAQITGSNIDETTTLFTPFHINFGKHTTIGKDVFINFDCVFLDMGGITIEDGVLIAPKVSLLTEGHGILPAERHNLFTKAIHIKKNAWIGANATILPGVTIGENSIVAAGAVVSKDVPDNVMVGGLPAKVLKNI